MAFEATLIVVRSKSISYSDLVKNITPLMRSQLNMLGLDIQKETTIRDYLAHTKSSNIPRYIRVLEKRSKDNPKKSIPIDNDPYEGGIFVSPNYAMIIACGSTDTSGNHVSTVWINFSKRLTAYFPSLTNVPFAIGGPLSERIGREVHVLHATSYSRSSDRYALFYNGRNANPLSGKGALTTVKNTYGLDINVLMDSVDRCLAILFAPYDINDAQVQLEKHKQRIAEFESQAQNLIIRDKQDGSNMVERFRKENEILLSSLQERYNSLKSSLTMDPDGIIYPFVLCKYVAPSSDIREIVFGNPSD